MPKFNFKNLIDYALLLLSIFISLSVYHLNNYSLQIIALLVLLYIGGELILNHTNFIKYKKEFDTFFLSTIILSIVFSTGAITSPLFFLLYFLLFGVSLFFVPGTSIFLVVLISVFLMFTPKKEILYEFLQISSLFLVVPLAHIFGSTYKKLLTDEEKIKVLAKEGERIESKLEKREKKVVSWTENDFSKRLSGIWQDFSKITEEDLPPFKQKLVEKIKEELRDLLRSAQEMEKEIED